MKSKRQLKEEFIEILKELETRSFATISTAKDNKPHSATIHYTVSGSFLYFITQEDSRKGENIISNPNVSLVVIEKSKTPISIQVSGKARVVESEEEAARALGNFTKIWYSIEYSPPVLNIPQHKTLLIRIDIKNIQWFQTAERPEGSKIKKIKFNYTNK